MINTYREQYPFQNYFALTHNPIGFLSDVLRECGDFARINIVTFRFYFVNDPDLIREALIEKHDVLIIEGGVSGGLARLIGRGILTNNGDRWRESRRTLQPLFHHHALETYASIMRDRVQESLDRWRSKFSATSFPINRELLSLSFRITCSSLFRYLPTFEEAEEFADAIWVLQSDGMRRYMTGCDVIDWVPLPINRRVNCAKATLTRLAQKTIERGADLPLDEILSILFAGTESPSNTLCWALKLLDDHPEWRETLADSISRDNDDVDVLSQVISEAIRLYPAGWAFERFAAQDATLGEEVIQRGSRLLFSPFLLHRNPRFWREPETFDPTRFTNGHTVPDGVPKYAYLPFGAGPRSCIGSRMAWLEMRVILGMLVAQCRWTIQTLSTDSPLIPQGSFKIRLSHPLFARMDFGPS
jgi:enediyne biosynthesis protein E7